MFSLSCKSPLLLFLLTAVGVATRLTDSWSHLPAEGSAGQLELQGLGVETHVSEPEGYSGLDIGKHSITQPIPVICKPPFLSGSQPLAG